jgi:hypothetical protein
MCLHCTIPLSTSAFSTPKRPLIAHNKRKLAVPNTPPPPNTAMSLTTKEEEVSHISPDWDMIVYSTPITSIQNDSPPDMPPLKRCTPRRQQILDFDFLDEHDTLDLSLPSLVRMTRSCSAKDSIQDEIFIPCKLSIERMGFRPRIMKNVE